MNADDELDSTDNYVEILDKYYESDGVKIVNNLLPIKTYHFIMARNFHELIKNLDYHNSIEGMMHLWEWKNRPILKEFMNEIIRLLHNYLSSAVGMIDITRNVLKKHYSKTPLLQEISSYIKSNIANDELLNFVKDLRHYIVHYKIPSPTASLSMEDISSNDVYFEKSTLLKWNGWSASGKAYLRKAPDEISIHSLITDYHKSISTFHEVLNKTVSAYHEIEFKEMHDLEQALKKLNAKSES